MTAKLLKTFSFIVIMSTLGIIMFGIPKSDKVYSMLIYNSSFNLIPYVETNDLVLMTNETIDEYTPIETFNGTITGYGPDCVGCSGITASGLKVATLVNGKSTNAITTYDDPEFGTVRILAAATAKFPFGTIVRISGSRIDGYITGIVLDRGGAMNNAYYDGEILMDLLFETEYSDEVYIFGRQKNVTFEILRYGR